MLRFLNSKHIAVHKKVNKKFIENSNHHTRKESNLFHRIVRDCIKSQQQNISAGTPYNINYKVKYNI
jgi:hypothetical protein